MNWSRRYRARASEKRKRFKPGALRCWVCEATVATTREAYEKRAKLCDAHRERCTRDGRTSRDGWAIVYTGPVQEELGL